MDNITNCIVILIILINHCRLVPLTAAVSREASLESSCLITIFSLITLRPGVTNKISCWKSKSLIKFLVEIQALSWEWLELFTLVIISKSTTEPGNNHLFSSSITFRNDFFQKLQFLSSVPRNWLNLHFVCFLISFYWFHPQIFLDKS